MRPGSFRIPWLLLALAGWLAVLTPAQAAPGDEPSLGPEDEAVLALFAGLGLPSPGEHPWVRVWLPAEARGCRARARPRLGFLLERTPERALVSHGLWPVSYRLQPGEDATQVARLEEFEGVPEERYGSEVNWSNFVHRRAKPSKVLALALQARLFAEHDAASATALLEEAREVTEKGGQGLEARVGAEFSRLLLWSILEAFQEPDLPLADLQERLVLLSERFPASPAAACARRYLDALAETRTEMPARVEERELGRELLELETPFRELVSQLRGLRNPRGWPSRAGEGQALLDPRGAASPAARLLELGPHAVPTLLELLGDGRLTRILAAAPQEPGNPDQALLRYGDVAAELLSEMAGRDLETPSEARAWWAQVQELGSVEGDLARARAEPRGAAGLVWRVYLQDPERGLEAALELAPHLAGSGREQLLRLLVKDSTERATALLARAPGPPLDLAGRLRVARIQANQSGHAWVAPLLHCLRQEVDSARPRELRRTIRLLITRGGVAGLTGLRRVYPRLGTRERAQVLQLAGSVRGSLDANELAEGLLVAALGDETVVESISLGRRFGWLEPTLGGLASAVLAARLGLPFERDIAPPERTRQARQLANAWRAERGLAPFALSPPELVPCDPARAGQLQDTVRRTLDLSDLLARVDEARAGGFGAVAAIRPALATHPLRERSEVRAALQALASVAWRVDIEDPGELLDRERRAQIEALRGRALTEEHAETFLLALTPNLLTLGAAGRIAELELHVHRSQRGDGLWLGLQLRARDAAAPRLPQVRARLSMRHGHRARPARSRAFASEALSGSPSWRELEKGLGMLMRCGPETGGELRLQLQWFADE